MFHSFSCEEFAAGNFGDLIQGVSLETVGLGRQGVVLVLPDEFGKIPLVRTTARFENPSRRFHRFHRRLAEHLQTELALRTGGAVPAFNNALLEVYSPEYRKMGFHSDHALDLLEESWICLFTCYDDPASFGTRVLCVKDKATGQEQCFPLEHRSAICFSTGTNARFLHKIVLSRESASKGACAAGVSSGTEGAVQGRWLGVTFRTSKTFLDFEPRDSPPHLADATKLRMAIPSEAQEFRNQKGRENQSLEPFAHPSALPYTLSPGDLRIPVPDVAELKSTCLLLLHREKDHPDAPRVLGNFSGRVEHGTAPRCTGHTLIFLAGDVDAFEILPEHHGRAVLLVVRELSYHYDPLRFSEVSLGELPLSVHGLGVLSRRFFDPSTDWFSRVQDEHTFQNLTESNKAGHARRTGLYITEVTEDKEGRRFRLLRCSSNFTGPTEGLRATDREILDRLNRFARHHFTGASPVNHVLAQIYRNDKDGKATIQRHSDKTKDMPTGGLMAFCTFYAAAGCNTLSSSAQDPYDVCHKGVSALTRLVFKRKNAPLPANEVDLPKEFAVLLYPNSVFLMPLSTNRLYTHEIRASALPAEMLPTRMGYVARCSDREAIYKPAAGQVFLRSRQDGDQRPMHPPSAEQVENLRRLYYLENTDANPVVYPEMFFSLNGGDYTQPTL